MPDTIQGFPYFPLAYDKDQQAVKPNTEDDLIAFAKANPQPTDLFVISHGWNNDMKAARDLYDRIFGEVKKALTANTPPGLGERKFAVAGVYWPSMKFAESELIPGGAAGAAAKPLDPLLKDAIAIATPDQAKHLKALATAIKKGAAGNKEAVKRMRALLTEGGNSEGEPAANPAILKELSDAELMRRLSGEKKPKKQLDENAGGAAGLSDFLGNLDSSIRSGIGFWTYWSMKDRAGKTGANALAPALDRIAKAAPALRIHLIGHSFGARLVTAAAMAGSFNPRSMTLLQAAFSHNGFSPEGFFRKVVTSKTVKGPILVTFTEKDKAVGLSYPIASRLNGDSTSGLGGPTDKFGGLGRNGAQNTVESQVLTLHGPESPYKWAAGTSVFNLDGNAIIGGHSDIVKPEIAYALLSSISS